LSTWMPCGLTNIPAPKLATSLPDGSNLSRGATFDEAQASPWLAPPQRSNTQTLRPSRSISIAAVDPIVRPSGSLKWFATTWYGFGWELLPWAVSGTFGPGADSAIEVSPADSIRRQRNVT